MMVVDVDNSRLVDQIQYCHGDYLRDYLLDQPQTPLPLRVVYELIYYVHGVREYSYVLDYMAERYYVSDYGLADAFLSDVTNIVTKWVESIFYPHPVPLISDIWFCRNYFGYGSVNLFTYMYKQHWNHNVQGEFGSTMISPPCHYPTLLGEQYADVEC